MTETKNAATQEVAKEVVTKGIGDTATAEDIVKAMVELSKGTENPISKVDARRALELVKDAICAQVERGCKVQLTGFLQITPIYKPVRTVFNIATKQPMETKEGVMVMAKVGKHIKQLAAAYDENAIRVYRDEYNSKKKDK